MRLKLYVGYFFSSHYFASPRRSEDADTNQEDHGKHERHPDPVQAPSRPAMASQAVLGSPVKTLSGTCSKSVAAFSARNILTVRRPGLRSYCERLRRRWQRCGGRRLLYPHAHCDRLKGSVIRDERDVCRIAPVC